MRRVKVRVGQVGILVLFAAFDSGYALDSVTRLVAEPYPTYMRPACINCCTMIPRAAD
jgi:hypothetical protein